MPLSRFAALAWLMLFAFVASVQAAEPPYDLKGRLDLTTLLAPPPTVESQAGKDDLAAVLAEQERRTEALAAQAKADAEVSIFRFANVIGEGFTADRLPRTARLFERLANSVSAVVTPAKDHWARPRPFLASTQVQPTSRPEGATYPSGHGTIARMYAIVLADLIPEKRAAIFSRGDEYAWGRIVNGVHYPSDVSAGAIAGTLIAAELRRDAGFREDFDAAKAELAEALRPAETKKAASP
ncbi:acid phosphatase [Tahibacter amnicola]|uniref:Acid phosphatase n=1 Tax=Tahibacter amnicola TaxID=2976241 RepID=A0ABY6BAH8_9GAMM|nr:phosphatase PAP2 family protein [Tahibacter amnicola]UXI66869.1 phosphatase PAP2 family protein [Tahibacter amnicola]